MVSRFPIPFRYPGGKFYAIEILRPYWSSIFHDEYREPFVGGGSVFFHKEKVDYNWLNDIDNELITTYKIMCNPIYREALGRMVENEVASPERWLEVLNFIPKNDLEVAFKYYYLNRTSFSGKLTSPAWGYRPKRSLPPERWKERIIPCGEKLENTLLTNCDFEDVINAPSKGKHTLLFVDPPYFSPPKKKHYRFGLTEQDHIRLMNALKNTNHSFFLTYDDVPEVRQLYNWANIYETSFFYRVDDSSAQSGKRKLGFELIITNYKLPTQLELFKY